MIPYWLNKTNLGAISLVLLLFVYTILALSTASIRYFETIQRVTMLRIFDQSLFGSSLADSLAAIGLMSLFLVIAFRSAAVRVASALTFGASIAASLLGFQGIPIVMGLATLPFVAVLLLLRTLAKRSGGIAAMMPLSLFASLNIDAKRVAMLFLIGVIILETGTLAKWIAYPAFPSPIYSDPSWRFAELESALFHSFGRLSAIMVVLIVFSFLYKDSISSLMRKRQIHLATGKEVSQEAFSSIRSGQPDSDRVSAANHPPSYRSPDWRPAQRTSLNVGNQAGQFLRNLRIPQWAVLLVAVLLSIVIMLYPLLPGVNVSGSGISSDERQYISLLAELRNLQSRGSITSSELVSAIFNIGLGDRPLSILLMLALGDVTGLSDATIVRFLPVFLAPAFVVSSYSFVKHAYLSRKTDIDVAKSKPLVLATVAIAAAVSPQIVVGLYGGFLANWLALIPVSMAMLLTVRICDEAERMETDGRSRKRLTIYWLCLYGTLTATMLLHVYTWGYLIIMLMVFTSLSYFVMRKSRSVTGRGLVGVTTFLVSVIIVSIVTDYAKSAYFTVSPGFVTDSVLAASSFSFQNFNSRWETIDFTLTNYVGGFLSHPGIAMFSLLWVFKGSYLRGFDRLMFCMIFILAIPVFFGTSVIQARALYLVPFFIPAALSLYNISRKNNLIVYLAASSLILSMAVYTLRAMANLYLSVPAGYELDEPFLLP